MSFENRLNDLILLSNDWRTNEIFKTEAQRLVAELMARTGSTEDRRTLSRDLGGLLAVISRQENWLKNQLMILHDPMTRRPEVSWVM